PGQLHFHCKRIAIGKSFIVEVLGNVVQIRLLRWKLSVYNLLRSQRLLSLREKVGVHVISYCGVVNQVTLGAGAALGQQHSAISLSFFGVNHVAGGIHENRLAIHDELLHRNELGTYQLLAKHKLYVRNGFAGFIEKLGFMVLDRDLFSLHLLVCAGEHEVLARGAQVPWMHLEHSAVRGEDELETVRPRLGRAQRKYEFSRLMLAVGSITVRVSGRDIIENGRVENETAAAIS